MELRRWDLRTRNYRGGKLSRARGRRIGRPIMLLVAATLLLALWPAAAGAVTEDSLPAKFAYAASTEPEAGGNAVAGVDQAVTDSVVRIYLAVFDRQPDAEGLAYWVDQYVGGTGLFDIAGAFMISTEWSNRYGSVDDERFVDLLYSNVLK